jgi:hypothetical protein
MYCKFQIYKDSEWVDFGQVIAPLNLGDSIAAETTSSYSIGLYFGSLTDDALSSLTPGTLCRINMDSRIYWLVIVDGGLVEPKTGTSFCYHSYTVQEMICALRETFVQTAFFTQAEYTVAEFLERLIALAKSPYDIVISTEPDYMTLEKNWKNPDYQIASNSLLDNLIKIGLNNQVRPKARINSSGKFEIYFIRLRGTHLISSIDGVKIGEAKQYQGGNYASEVHALVENMGSDGELWFPEDDMEFGVLAEPDNDAVSAESASNLVIRLPYNIKSATELRAIGFFDSSILTTNVLYDKNHNLIFDDEAGKIAYLATLPLMAGYTTLYRNITGIPVTVKIVEYKEWLMLDPDGTDPCVLSHQQNTLYYKRGENKIYNGGILTDFADPSSELGSGPIYYTTGVGEQTPIYQYLIPALNYYVIKCNLYFDGQVTQRNDMAINRNVFYSQEENLVSGRSLLANMRNYIESMKNMDESVTYEFDAITKMPKAGDIYNSKVIASVTFQMTYAAIQATLALSDELVKKSEYLSADDGLSLPDIRPDKAFNRVTNYMACVWFCRSQSEAAEKLAKHGISTYLGEWFPFYSLDSMSNSRSIVAKIPAEILVKTGEYESDPLWTALDLSVKVINRSLLISWATRDNISAGPKLDTQSSTDLVDFRYYPVAFTKGSSKYITYKILTDSVRSSEANFPAIAEVTFNGANPLIMIDDEKYYHDVSEKIIGSMQVDFKTYHSTDAVESEFLLESSLIKDTKNGIDPYIRYIKIGTEYTDILHMVNNMISPHLHRIKVVFAGLSAEIGNEYVVRIYRKNTLTLKTDDMLIIRAAIESHTGYKAAVFYVAFTN